MQKWKYSSETGNYDEKILFCTKVSEQSSLFSIHKSSFWYMRLTNIFSLFERFSSKRTVRYALNLLAGSEKIWENERCVMQPFLIGPKQLNCCID